MGGVAAIIAGRRCSDMREAEAIVQTLSGSVDPEEIDRLDDATLLTPAERRAVFQQDRATWCTPDLATLTGPVMSPGRRAGLLSLRGYLLVAVVLVVVKIVEVGLG